MEQEVKNTIMIALGLVLTALLLGFIAYVFTFRSDFANAYNTNLAASEEVSTYMRFNKYDQTPLYGSDVIAAIRDYYDTSVEVAVNVNGSLVYDVTQAKAKANPSLVSMTYLSSLFQPTTEYRAVLVYNQYPVSLVTLNYQPPVNANYRPSAIVFFQSSSS